MVTGNRMMNKTQPSKSLCSRVGWEKIIVHHMCGQVWTKRYGGRSEKMINSQGEG